MSTTSTRGSEPAEPQSSWHARQTAPLWLRSGLLFLFAVFGAAGLALEPSQFDDLPRLKLTQVALGFHRPTDIVSADDGSGRLFVAEQAGKVRILKNGQTLETPFLDIGERVFDGGKGGEQGFLKIAFPPNFGQKRYFYVNYTARPDSRIVVSRFRLTANPDIADPASEEEILSFPQPMNNHFGGQLEFGPNDGYLYISVGDGDGENDPDRIAQRMDRLQGKILRIDTECCVGQKPPYRVPADNPFVQKPGALPEIWALGFRNPWRITFDRDNGDLYIADVGQNVWERINVQPGTSRGGENYGWAIVEGSHCFQEPNCDRTGLVMPTIEYSHDVGCAVIGGSLYRTKLVSPGSKIYVYGDYCDGFIAGLRRVRGGWQNPVLLQDADMLISVFGEDEAGNVYLAAYDQGAIYRLDEVKP